ncbi:Alpha/Beta hydrolase protein [Mycena filopes]|nr:Alpha/Beta hydrolase protein [Mycena filopes]
MPSLTLENGVTFAYTDSGALEGDYTTFLIIHGHTFHSGTFHRLTPLAAPNALRIICVNRREYPGSSPFTPAELTVFASGSDAERAAILAEQGHDLALFTAALIAELNLPEGGGVALVGWSMGTIFLLSLVACINTLPADTKALLTGFVRSVILLQPPSLTLGLPDPPGMLIPHTDPTIPPSARGPAFAKWVSSFFAHGDLALRALSSLTYPAPSDSAQVQVKAPTLEKLSPTDLGAMTSFAPGDKYDNVLGLPPFAPLVAAQVEAGLFDPRVRMAWASGGANSDLKRNQWGGAKFWHVYGDAEPWNVIWAGWYLEDRSAAAVEELKIQSKVVEGANHFLVWEDPEGAIGVLKGCL